MPQYFAMVALGGALGAMARYALSIWLAPLSENLAWGTLAANLLGSFLAGMILAWLQERHMAVEVRLLFQTGLLGALTTFSTFAAETLVLFLQHKPWAGLTQWALNVVGTMIAVFLGFLITRAVLGLQ
ncbi:fluoride efflux transporter CrcB [Sulfidibacter corallicola]|uniref:Fluoride-specific ion channel FluC n=1 Tax=Sulfidibacter corallicola TaxID=2818388 RepID=A0A8A4TP89_SULCO|nr:fluoride efflux transporter CrcB [Sulfidibacter corallicola]QTD51247.1 fluoride efflux transporter CrcB [Sulfidibacter corallicola]